MEKKIYIANIVSIILIIILGYMILFTTSVEIPDRVKIPELQPTPVVQAEDETIYNPSANTRPDLFPDLGKVSIIRTLFTPTPTPTPRKATPTPAPDLSKILQDWALLGIIGGECVMENRKTKEELSANQGEEVDIMYRNQEVKVKIKEVNEDDDYVVFEAYGKTKKVGLF